MVFTFVGRVPSRRDVRYVKALIADPSGHRSASPVAQSSASACPQRWLMTAPHATAPGRIAFALPDVMTVVRSGDFEGVLSHGIGLAKRTSFHVFTLTTRAG